MGGETLLTWNELLGWVLMSIGFFLAIIWLVTLLTRIREITMFAVLFAPFLFFLGDYLVDSGDLPFWTVIVLSVIFSAIAGFLVNVFTEIQESADRAKQRKDSKEKYRQALEDVKKSRKYKELIAELNSSLKKGILYSVSANEFSSFAAGLVNVECTKTRDMFFWDGSGEVWRVSDTSEKSFFPWDARTEKKYSREDTDAIKTLVDEYMKSHVNLKEWDNTFKGGWKKKAPQKPPKNLARPY